MTDNLDEEYEVCKFCREAFEDCWCPEGGPDEMMDYYEDLELRDSWDDGDTEED